MRYNLYCGPKPYGTSVPPFSSTKVYLPSNLSVSKLLSIQQFDNFPLINLLTTILPNGKPLAYQYRDSDTELLHIVPLVSSKIREIETKISFLYFTGVVILTMLHKCALVSTSHTCTSVHTYLHQTSPYFIQCVNR